MPSDRQPGLTDSARSSFYEAAAPMLPLVLPAVLAFLFATVLLWRWDDWRGRLGLDGAPHFVDGVPTMLLIFCAGMLVVRLAHGYAQRRLGHRPPRLVRQIIALTTWTVAIGAGAAILWDIPVGSLMTTSGLLVAVIGLALKNMLSDLFNGISLPVKVGDWIEVGGARGRVIEISWRATKLVTTDHVLLVVPNTQFITNTVRNFTSDRGFYRDHIKVTLPMSVTAYQATRILLGAANQVDLIASLPEAPEARIAGFNEHGVEWDLAYSIPDAGMTSKMRHRIQRSLLRDFFLSGIELPAAHVEIHRPTVEREAGEPAEVMFLRLIDVFCTLTEGELRKICDQMKPRLLETGLPVVRQGEKGDSLFIVHEGLLKVTIANDHGVTEVGRVRPGQFFGEMSLMTGAPRSATVTPMVDSKAYEISRELLAPILCDRPEVAALMSEVLAERQIANAPKLGNGNAQMEERETLAQQILHGIVSFFRLPVKGRAYSSQL
jgi:small-conductance mechanosensitive channel